MARLLSPTFAKYAKQYFFAKHCSVTKASMIEDLLLFFVLVFRFYKALLFYHFTLFPHSQCFKLNLAARFFIRGKIRGRGSIWKFILKFDRKVLRLIWINNKNKFHQSIFMSHISQMAKFFPFSFWFYGGYSKFNIGMFLWNMNLIWCKLIFIIK